jgi:GGDEF domain-containing protein
VAFAYSPSAPAPPETAPERQAIGRIAAGIWAAIAFFGALATVRPLRFPEMDVSATRAVVLSATVIAAITFVLPWGRLPRAFVNVLLVLMAGYITALAHVSGVVGSDLMMFVTFGIALAVCFLPVRTSVVEVVIIAVLLGAALILLDKDNAGADALRTSLLLAVLVVLCGLVLILRAVIAEREEAVGPRLFDGGVLEARGFDKMLDRELSRAARHNRPLSIVQFEVSGAPASKPDHRVLATVSRTILDRLRVEDSAGHLSGLRFALIAPETGAAGAATIAENITEVLRTEVEALGYDRSQFEIAVGWANYPHHADSRPGLLSQAQNNLEAAAVANQVRPSPPQPDASPAARAAPAGPDQH